MSDSTKYICVMILPFLAYEKTAMYKILKHTNPIIVPTEQFNSVVLKLHDDITV
jgi:hypothetical protein